MNQACKLSHKLDWNRTRLIRRIFEKHSVYWRDLRCALLRRTLKNVRNVVHCCELVATPKLIIHTGHSLFCALLFSLSVYNERGYFIVKLSKREQETSWCWQPTFDTFSTVWILKPNMWPFYLHLPTNNAFSGVSTAEIIDRLNLLDTAKFLYHFEWCEKVSTLVPQLV